jgi:hypothetical protein
LESAIPVRFVRNRVIGDANRDLVLAVAAGAAVTIDRIHGQVVAQRFNDDDGWRLRGYAVPILFPHVGDLPWTAIADLRRKREMARFRAVLREVETEAMAEAANGDIEAAAHHAYERHLAAAVGKLEGMIGPARRAVTGLIIGGGASSVAAPDSSPWASLAQGAFWQERRWAPYRPPSSTSVRWSAGADPGDGYRYTSGSLHSVCRADR